MLSINKVLGIIPSRLSSTRLPNKPLAMIHGKPMVQWVYESAKKSKYLSDVVVAVDSMELLLKVESFGGKAILTSDEHTTGTARVLETSIKMPGFDLYVNIQGDEPLIRPEHIDKVCEVAFPRLSEAAAGTICVKIENKEDLFNKNMVKVVFSKSGRCLYFSRSPIPYVMSEDWQSKTHYKHMGIYSYSPEFLNKLSVGISVSPLEESERLEQLSWLYNNIPIYIDLVEKDTIAVDTQEDLDRVIAYMDKQC